MNQFQSARDRLIDTSKAVSSHYKEQLQAKWKANKPDDDGGFGAGGGGGGGVLVNEGDAMVDKELDDAHRRASRNSNLYSFEPPLVNPYQTKFLTTLDGLFCCSCRKRWQLAVLANVGFIIVFGIRTNFGAARTRLSNDWTDGAGVLHAATKNWTAAEKGLMEGSFFYGYIITQLPGGFLAAKFAPNKLFGIALGMASFLNLFMPLAIDNGIASVVFVQAAQGFVQGVSYPAMHGVWRYWAPPLERSKLATTAFTGSYAGAVVGLPLSTFLVNIGWRVPFYFYGTAGVIWAFFWFAMTFEKPATHPTITDEERKHIESSLGKTSNLQLSLGNIPWFRILTSLPVWAIIVANFARSWTFYLLLNSQLQYMQYHLHMSEEETGWLAAVPHAVMACMVLVGGHLADHVRQKNILTTTSVRKVFNCGGFGGEAFFLALCAYAKDPTWAMICLTLAVGSSGFAISGFNVNHLDIAPRYAALLMGMSNGMGTFAGMICPVVTEIFRTEAGGWKTVFLIAALIHFTGVVFYAIFASGEQQNWAEPTAEEEPVNDDFGLRAQAAGIPQQGYGSTADEKIAPLPDILQDRSAYGNTA